ncbi:LysR family transcriptional regulator [Streptosporangium sp. NBC_01469]|uniref:LysR family transcriptional regulator n=1 Tax=Streptosporangium sp. NBC_01469 TaxID=2903898 RepID=UPI002E2B139F|nr:LysR family transcriptional regulator [Streptosporangium sp. NBC_01469]
MDPHLLRTFVTVADRRSFSDAATELGYTQSAVSQQIAALEADLGLALLHRRPVAPTPAGERLLEHAGPLLLRHRAARADVLRAAAGPAGRLAVVASSLACTPAIVRSLSPDALGGTRVGLRTVARERVAGRSPRARPVSAWSTGSPPPATRCGSPTWDRCRASGSPRRSWWWSCPPATRSRTGTAWTWPT